MQQQRGWWIDRLAQKKELEEVTFPGVWEMLDRERFLQRFERTVRMTAGTGSVARAWLYGRRGDEVIESVGTEDQDVSTTDPFSELHSIVLVVDEKGLCSLERHIRVYIHMCD